MHGILIIDKPRGPTSADVVAEVKRRLRAEGAPRGFAERGAERSGAPLKVGHTGTLDPMATGVLPIAVGEGTKLAPFLLADDKAYEGELELGITTTTLDIEGEVTGRGDPSGVSRAALAAALAAWVGDREQIPPMYSALHLGGQRLHTLARAGIEVDRTPRPIRIDRLELLAFEPPKARFAVVCSKGTYIRSLVRDVGEALGCGATLTALRRTAAGGFTLAQAISLSDVTPDARLIDPVAALAFLPALRLDAAGVRNVQTGRPLPAGEHAEKARVRLLTPDGDLAAVAEVTEGRLRTLRVLNYGLTGPGR